jgi:tripeptidyl-peptidase-1
MVVHPPELPSGWSVGARASSETVRLLVSVRSDPAELAALAARVEAVSDPESPLYGQHLSASETRRAAAASPEALQAVNAFFGAAASVSETHADGSTLGFSLPASAAETLLGTEIHHVSHAASGERALRAVRPYSLPSTVAASVEAIFGLHGLPLTDAKGAILGHGAQTPGAPMAATVEPTVITKVYSIAGVVPKGDKKNRQAVAEFQGQKMSTDDLTTFFNDFLPKDSGSDASVFAFHGEPVSRKNGHGMEAELDIQYIMGTAPGIKTEFYEQKSIDFCSDLKAWTTLLLSTDDIPLVHSVSYGIQSDPVKTLGCKTEEITVIDNDFMKLAARGITIIFASGDSGSGYVIEGAVPNPTSPGKLYPSWPAGSPWVTAVGATRLINDQVSTGAEAAVGKEDRFGSGGGFSYNFDQPKWQAKAVAAYLAEEKGSLPDESKASYITTGRATPDVSALGTGYSVVVGGSVQKGVGGTSASAPVFAGIVSLLNEQRINAGKSAMGFLNPFIYANPQAFTDVVKGDNKLGRGGMPQPGFECAKGWDPVTGVGTPVFPKLLKAAMAAAGYQPKTIVSLAPASETMTLLDNFSAGVPHYEDPNTTGSCQAGELDVQIQGIQGKMCSPKCSAAGACPTDVPAGVTAKPQCALQGGGAKYCALICSPSTKPSALRAGKAQCGKNASCKAISGVGICTYAK